MPVIESKLTFFEVQIEGRFSHAAELYDTDFSEGPEAFDAVDMVGSEGEKVLAVIDAVVLLVAQIDQGMIGPKAVGMDGRLLINLAFENRIKRFTRAVRDYLGIDLSVSFVNAEDDGFAVRSASSLAANSLCTKV